MKQILFLFCLSASFASAQSYGEAVSYQDRHRDYTHEMLQTMRDYDNHKERSEYVYESSGNNKKVREWVDMGSIEKDSIDKMYNHSWIDLPETPLEDGIYKASIFLSLIHI